MKRSIRIAFLFVPLALLPAHAAEILPGETTATRPSHAVALRNAGPSVGETEGGAAAWPAGLWSVIEVSWSELESAPGQLDLTPLRERLDRAAAPPERTVVALDADTPPAGGDLDGWSRAWQGLLRTLVRDARDRADWYLLGGLVGGDGARSALELKLGAVTVRAEDPGAGVAFAIDGAAGIDGLQKAFLTTGDLEPYVDGVALRSGVEGAAESLAATKSVLLSSAPGASLWLLPERVPPGLDGPRLLSRTLAAVAAGADLVAWPSGDGDLALERRQQLTALAERLPPGLGLAPRDGAGIEAAPDAEAVEWVRFFDEESFQEVVAYWPTGPTEGDSGSALIFDEVMRRGYRIVDPVSGTLRYARTTGSGSGKVRVELPLGPGPRLVLVTRQKVSPGFDAELEQAESRGKRLLTAEEIIAAHQRWRTFQDDRLLSVARGSRISMRFRYGLATGTIDVSLDTDYFWDRQTGEEWSIREKYVNGVRLKWDKLPELPLINQEQVVQAPLDLNLDKRYRYERNGEQTVAGRLCWRLRFEPLDASESLYRGEAWIDQATGAMVQVRTRQTGLEGSLISDEETQLYQPFEGPDGASYWLPQKIDGQLIYSIQGGNLVVLREITFEPPRINQPGFYESRDAAYRSERQMLRQTGEGFKWLARTEDGGRVVREKGDTRQLFALGGVLRDEGTDGVIPLAGVNYTDIDFRGKGQLLNIFFAGALANVSLSDPSALGGKLDLGVTLNAVGFKSTDKFYLAGVEDELQRVRSRTQSLTFTAGYPLGSFVKLRGIAGLAAVEYDDAKQTAADFTLPPNHLRTSLAVEAAFDRNGWGLIARRNWFSRSKWEPWGAAGMLTGAGETAAAKDYTTWSASGIKSWFLPFFQKIEVSGTYRAGADLDRFSAFDFGFFGSSRVRGFGGSGIRYDRGAQLQLQYSFNLRDVIRFDAVIDQAHVHDASLSDSFTDHTGFGIAANFVGPWRTLWRADVGYAVKSDLAEAEGQTEFMLVVLRLW